MWNQSAEEDFWLNKFIFSINMKGTVYVVISRYSLCETKAGPKIIRILIIPVDSWVNIDWSDPFKNQKKQCRINLPKQISY